jgi:hypothetical protein
MAPSRKTKRDPDRPRMGSGIQPDGTWIPQHPKQRPPLQPGHDLSVQHGAYVSPLKLGERTQEIADSVRPYLPTYSPAVEPTLGSYALCLVRIERGAAALEEVELETELGVEYKRKGEDDLLFNLRSDVRAWIRLAAKLAAELGITPASSARIMRDVGVGVQAAAQHRVMLERYRGEK